MKLFSAKPKPPGAGTPLVIYAPGDHFFMRRFELPAGMGAAEVDGFVALQLEELSPFPLEQLYHGHAVADDRSAVFAYAVYRRRFPPGNDAAWASVLFVLPDFAPALGMTFERPTAVLFRSEQALTALRFEAGKKLPVRAASRPLAAEAAPGEAEAVRAVLLAAVAGDGLEIVELRAAGPAVQRAQGVAFPLVSGAGAGESAIETVIPTAECWAMDVREAAFVARQRKRLGVDLVLWRIALGAAAGLALLFLGEALLLAGQGYVGWLSGRVAARVPIATSLEDKDLVANRLTDFGRSGLSPFAMLAAASGPKPDTVYFTRATAEGRNKLVIDANTQNVADVNNYEAALRSLPEVQAVEVRKVSPREEGTTFSVEVTFKAGAFERPVSAPGVAAAGGGS